MMSRRIDAGRLSNSNPQTIEQLPNERLLMMAIFGDRIQRRMIDAELDRRAVIGSIERASRKITSRAA